MSARVAIFGGSFNPPHVAHVLAVTYVLATEDLDEILVVPCFRHPFAKELAPFEDRFAMCELAMAWLPKVTVSRVEQELGGESRTLRTVEHFVVIGKSGFSETRDSGKSWQPAAPLPEGFTTNRVGPNYAWDPAANIFYASTMMKPTFALRR